jgi:type II restriction/modification system DNA methylase subunit YeeA
MNLSTGTGRSQHDKITSLVEQMLAATQQVAAARTDRDKEYYDNKCSAIDRQIDALVYELYGLTDDDIKIVEATG